MAAALQMSLQKTVEELQKAQKDHNQSIKSRSELDAQFKENEVVKAELELVKDADKVFKLIGPALISQDLEEAKSTVQKRLDYIAGEMKRIDKSIKETENKQDQHRESLQKLQMQMKKLQTTN